MMKIFAQRVPQVLMFTGGVAILVAMGCSSDEGAKKDDEAMAAEEEAPADEPAAEEPAKEEAEPEASGPDLSAYDGAARVTPATSGGGVEGFRIAEVTDGGGYANCGLANEDIVVEIDGAAVPAGKPGVDALIDACENKKAITVERGGENTTLNAAE